MKINKEFILELAEDVMLELTDEEAEEITSFENDILEKFEKVFAINTDNVRESHYPFDYNNTYLREDDEIRTIDREMLLKNAPKHEEGYVVIEKVVK
ncbi:Asp-tRNA(Asn)/Glu-tRNA(Gln) amidotransferase subunit GatC [Spiroplasma culicicola]|uniref:Glutamyl-tRNA(Gln) amidotransferase subunit C n=1 Tax=Spiroplasma culicicola AES-1 TaxID=1276246 RepID=W6A6H8_9MOLU|nr:Asp-tRNA(Asn)/Glu-tRNA(Gln) amidotransferase subunit GatC [Spiroplasma culicicola]AHI52470.1 glutamyl-tRNA(Gln) amidotransferase subunit C [Spiroplasma culicicola AES-1]